LGVLFLTLSAAVFSQTKQDQSKHDKVERQEPPEEDVPTDRVQEYVFNPLQAAKELKVGNYYFKKGSYKAAQKRFEEALKWDATSAEAWLRLGDAHEKLKNMTAARDAWKKYLELDSKGKDAEAVRKRLGEKL
jgi:tetratricopeptide (TPR) repeat protein